MVPQSATDWASARGLVHVLKRDGDIAFPCPRCGRGTMHVHTVNGWFFCFGGELMCASGKSLVELDQLFERAKQ